MQSSVSGGQQIKPNLIAYNPFYTMSIDAPHYSSQKFLEETIGLAKKSHYITPIFSQPQHISFFINNRLCAGWNFYANPFVILLFYITYLEFNFFR